jgi:hypothetical protein
MPDVFTRKSLDIETLNRYIAIYKNNERISEDNKGIERQNQGARLQDVAAEDDVRM